MFTFPALTKVLWKVKLGQVAWCWTQWKNREWQKRYGILWRTFHLFWQRPQNYSVFICLFHGRQSMRGRWNVVGRRCCCEKWGTEEEKDAKIISLRDDRIPKRIQGKQTERGEREAGCSKKMHKEKMDVMYGILSILSKKWDYQN